MLYWECWWSYYTYVKINIFSSSTQLHDNTANRELPHNLGVSVFILYALQMSVTQLCYFYYRYIYIFLQNHKNSHFTIIIYYISHVHTYSVTKCLAEFNYSLIWMIIALVISRPLHAGDGSKLNPSICGYKYIWFNIYVSRLHKDQMRRHED